MNKSALKKFAQFARTKLIADMKQQITYWQQAKEISGGLQTVDGKIVNGQYIKARQSMLNELKRKSTDELAEQAGYTRFNRIVAIKFMEHNKYLPTTYSWFSNEDGSEYPSIVHDAVNQARLIGLSADKINNYYEAHKFDDVYRELFVWLCNSLHQKLWFLFERIDDRSMLLFPQQLMGPSHIIKHPKEGLLSIPEEDWQEVEVIGRIYQYYISEKKDDLFELAKKKKKKFGKDELPAVTQLFTPKRIVQYMVHNTVGKTWLQNYPDESLQKKREFLIEASPDSGHITITDPKELTVLDPACGSWHILVTSYEVLYDIYLNAGYSRSSIPEHILKNNLYGFEICPRAHQLACFAVIMKAWAYDAEITQKVDISQNIICLEENNNYEKIDEQKYPHLRSFVRNWYHTGTYGSLIHVEEFSSEQILADYEKFQSQDGLFADTIVTKNSLEKLLHQATLMSLEYTNVVANPPYMASSKMSNDLKKYIDRKYNFVKSDLFSAFIIRNLDFSKHKWYLWYMTPYVWMFISSFEELRKEIIEKYNINSLIQLEYSWFDGATVPICTFTIKKYHDNIWYYIKLSDFRWSDIQEPKALEAINNHDCWYFYKFKQWGFNKIPWSPIAYWATEKVLNIFDENEKLWDKYEPKTWLKTWDTDRFTRVRYEIDNTKIWYSISSREQAKWSKKKRFPLNKWWDFRKRYGNNWFIVNREFDWKEIIEWCEYLNTIHTPWGIAINRNYYFRESISCGAITSWNNSYRFYPTGWLFDINFRSFFVEKNKKYYLLWFLNSKICAYIWWLLWETMALNISDLNRVPSIELNIDTISLKVEKIVFLSKVDRDIHETSYDFQACPLIQNKQKTLEVSYQAFCNIRTEKFFELHNNEEELNRQFIDIYWLQDELTPDVPLSEITILQDELDSKALKEQESEILASKKLPRKREIIAQQLMSYILWCIMGRYSLDVPGLVYAGGDFDSRKYKTFPADDDWIIPVLDDEYFWDDIVNQTKEFVKTVWWASSFTQNRSWLAQALWWSRNQSADEIIRNYRRKSFSDDHFKRYKKRPIYRYFSSSEKKGSGAFQVIVYLHRYDKDTISRIRNSYLDKFQRKIHNLIQLQETRKHEETDTKKLTLIEKELNRLQETQTELMKYDERLKHVAEERIELDLDDGVKVNYWRMMEKGLVVKYKL